VMTIRIYNKKSPFLADNNHIHHRLLELVPSHFKVTIIFILANVVIIAIALFLNQLSLNVNFQFLIVLLTGIILSMVPSVILRFKPIDKVLNSKQIKQFG
jgi:UDP-GlcNAc:undecaprenyl-phosphate/decaprenyl-phosphate GlcNAc-1-phosphate transferase